MNNQDKHLRDLLRQWKDIEPPGNFESNVWRRIRLGEPAGARPVGWRQWWQAILARPAVSVGLAMLAAIFIGWRRRLVFRERLDTARIAAVQFSRQRLVFGRLLGQNNVPRRIASMKRILWVTVLASLVASAVSFAAMRWLSVAKHPPIAAKSIHDLNWLQTKLQLSPDQMTKIRALADDYLAVIADCCEKHCGARYELSEELARETVGLPKAEAFLPVMLRLRDKISHINLGKKAAFH